MVVERKLSGYLFIIAAALFWGLIGIFGSLSFAEGIAPMEVAFWRACLTWPCFALQAFIAKEISIDRKDIPLFLIFAVFGIALFYISYLVAVEKGGAAFAAVLLYTAPAWVVLVAVFVYRERLTWIKIVAVILVISGVALISGTGTIVGGEGALGIVALLAGLGSGFCYSLYYTMGKYFSTKYSSANLFIYVLPLGALCIFPFVDFAHKSLMAWSGLVAVAVVSTFIANYCYYQGLKYLEAGRASIVATIEPVVAALAAYLFLGEFFSPMGYGGAGLILVAVLVIISSK